MEYNVENIRQLAERYFRGGTTLEEEAVLRDYFRNCDNVPADLEPCRLMFGHWAKAVSEVSRREIPLKDKAGYGRPLFAATVAVAAALLVGLFVVTGSLNSPGQDGIVCYVNGKPVTDQQQAAEYALGAIGLINESLRKPAEYLSVKSDNSPTIERVEEMLNMLVTE